MQSDLFCNYNELAYTNVQEEYCATPGVRVGVDDGVSSGIHVSKMLKFYLKGFM